VVGLSIFYDAIALRQVLNVFSKRDRRVEAMRDHGSRAAYVSDVIHRLKSLSDDEDSGEGTLVSDPGV